MVLGSVAFLVLFIACVNFINLTTAKSTEQMRGAGLRQIMGAGKPQILFQLLSESVLIAYISMAIAAGLVYLSAPVYASISGVSFDAAFGLVKKYLIFLPFLPLAIGLLSGWYPAYVISSGKPISALSAQVLTDSRSTFRNVLVALQFGISSFLIVGTLVINGQLEYLKKQGLGFDSDQIVVLNAGGPGVGERIHAIREEFLKHPGIMGVAAALTVPGDNAYMMNYSVSIDESAGAPGTMTQLLVDPDFLETMELTVTQGSGVFNKVQGDTTDVILNEAAVKELVAQYGTGWAEPLGKLVHEVDVVNGQVTVAASGRVTGVVKDFNYQSHHHAIRPLIIRANYNVLYKILVKVNPAEMAQAIDFMRQRWGTLVVNDRPFNYQFLDDRFALSYVRDENFRTIFRTFSLISILISCIGLYGLVLYVTERKSRETSIRKILGAEVPSLLLLFLKHFIRPVALAFAVVAPLSWLAMNSWLQQFAYQTQISYGIYLQAGAFAVIVALVTITTRIVKVSLANPVKYLKEN